MLTEHADGGVRHRPRLRAHVDVAGAPTRAVERRLVVRLTEISVVLCLISFVGEVVSRTTLASQHEIVADLIHRINVNEERNIPTWFSTVVLAACAGVAAMIARERSRVEHRSSGWWVVTAVLALCSLDEAAALHDGANQLLGDLPLTSGPFHQAWVIPGAIVAALAAVLMVRHLGTNAPYGAAALRLGVAVFLGGAVGLEMLGGMVVDTAQLPGLPEAIVWHLEELLEMIGASLVLGGLLQELRATDAAMVWTAVTSDRPLSPR